VRSLRRGNTPEKEKKEGGRNGLIFRPCPNGPPGGKKGKRKKHPPTPRGKKKKAEGLNLNERQRAKKGGKGGGRLSSRSWASGKKKRGKWAVFFLFDFFQ